MGFALNEISAFIPASGRSSATLRILSGAVVSARSPTSRALRV